VTNMTDEIWRPIKDFPDYEVSNLGRVRSFKRSPQGKILSPVEGRGYFHVGLWKNECMTTMSVHVLVIEAFKGSRPPGYEVSHLDNDGTNNHIDNLEWMTHSENVSMHKESSLGVKLSLDKAKEVRALFRTGKYSKKELAQQFGVTKANIGAIVHNKSWKESDG